jgi:ribosomal protein S27E
MKILKNNIVIGCTVCGNHFKAKDDGKLLQVCPVCKIETRFEIVETEKTKKQTNQPRRKSQAFYVMCCRCHAKGLIEAGAAIPKACPECGNRFVRSAGKRTVLDVILCALTGDNRGWVEVDRLGFYTATDESDENIRPKNEINYFENDNYY